MKPQRALAEGMHCAQCGKPGLTFRRQPEIFTYKGVTLQIDNYGVFACPICGEEYLDHVLIQETEPQIRNWQRQVDGLLTTEEIKAIRKKIGVSQAEFSRVLGGGPKSFAKYETGVVNQSAAMDQLLRLIRDVPGVWENLKAQVEKKRQDVQRLQRRMKTKKAA
ncbi:MAG: type II toxin-antitoxin system MqsA family antitoxin [Deltaproteobacteria bacterium]|nr:type II toxin-antitoxin system MqsA family antitoxin [Deltaproteobacteria bacterium]